MTEENNDLIEETSDGMENWVYYNNEQKPQESVNLANFNDTDQELTYIGYSLMDGDGEEQKYQYEDCNENSVLSSDTQTHSLKENVNHIEEQSQAKNDSLDEQSDHNLIFKETIDENGQLVEEYFCQHCNVSYDSIDNFVSAHPWFEIVNENAKKENVKQSCYTEPGVTESKLWDLVENLDEENVVLEDEAEDLKPNILEYDDSSQEKANASNTIETDKEHYFCYDCQQVFTDLVSAENHDCNNDLQNPDDLIEIDSNMLADNDNTYRCHLCDKDYPSLRSFTNHQRWHKKSESIFGYTKTLHEQPVVCKICNTIFACEKNLKLHMKMHRKQTVKTIQDALPVGAQEEYNDLNQFFCEICNKSFDQNLLGIHKNMHQNLEEYSCGKCNKNFENLPSYEIHMQMHKDTFRKGKQPTKKPNEQTEEAPSTSVQGSNDSSKRKHACQYCGKQFLRPYEKVKHERIHTGEKPYECEVCGKTFRVSYSLTLHLRTHTDIRPYVCATCNKRFKQQSVYVHHLKTHEAECAYKCDICGKSFRTSVQLGGHKNIHSKPYNCTECNRPFASLYAVKIHMKTHNKCHKSNKNLKNRCSICGASYARVFALSLHIKEQHGIDVDPLKLAAANANLEKKTQAETSNNLSVNEGIKFENGETDEDIESNEVNNEDENIYVSQVDHEENIELILPHNVYMDETEAATQTILNTEELSVDDHFPAEEIITDWLAK